MKQPCSSNTKANHAGFTLTELLVVLAVITLLGLMLLPALANTKGDGRVLRCMNNQRQLTQAWLLYTSDNADAFAPNPGWAAGFLDWTAAPDNTNRAILESSASSAIAVYVKAADLFKCPADTYQSGANLGPRVRSIALNGALGGNPAVQGSNPDGRIYYGSGSAAGKASKMTHLVKPGPANVFALTDEHPDYINDGTFFFDPGCSAVNEYFRELPGSFHHGAGGLSFADGHFELHLWTDPLTLKPVLFTTPIGHDILRNSADYIWMNSKMPYR